MNDRPEFDISDAEQLEPHAAWEEDDDHFVKTDPPWSTEELRRLGSDVSAVFRQLRRSAQTMGPAGPA